MKIPDTTYREGSITILNIIVPCDASVNTMWKLDSWIFSALNNVIWEAKNDTLINEIKNPDWFKG